MRTLLALAALAALALPSTAAACEPAPPGVTIAAHRGAAELAPENTLDAYDYAVAYGVDMIEVDVQQTLDGVFVAFHDTEVDAKTDGSGPIGLMTADQVAALNAADNDTWRGSAFDPARIPTLEEVLALADRRGVGIYVDMKESLTNVPAFMAQVLRYPRVVERSAFLPYEPGRAALITALAPHADLMFSNPDARFPAAALGALAAARYRWFGSDLENYSREKVAAIHGACGLVIPNVYGDDEASDLHAALALGADGAQIDLPDVTADALDEPVATRIEERPGLACLVDARHGIGLPRKPLDVAGATRTTDRHGCVPRPGAAPVRFAGDGSALPSVS
jgi:glycerophosphoryl diester phosphodiesterase